MGRVKGKAIKTAAKTLVNQFSRAFTSSFDENKAKVNELGILPDSKKERMKLAGEITVLMKRKAAFDPQKN
ncbi:hypothetical protein HY572_03600 [Candidatus Micrarchaeota archaeon]|nr:hypothetical protein [Candidatus Micrarchaeota archaeon]